MSKTEEARNFRKDLVSFVVDKLESDEDNFSITTTSTDNIISLFVEETDDYISTIVIEINDREVKSFKFLEHQKIYRNEWLLTSENSIDLSTGENWNKIYKVCDKLVKDHRIRLEKLTEHKLNKHFATEKIKSYLMKYKISKI